MGRPKKYLTKEAKMEAGRIAQRKYYRANSEKAMDYKMIKYYSLSPEERSEVNAKMYDKFVNKSPEHRKRYLDNKSAKIRIKSGTSVDSPTRKKRKWAFVGGKLIPVRTEKENQKYGRFLTHGLSRNNRALYQRLWKEAMEREKKKEKRKRKRK